MKGRLAVRAENAGMPAFVNNILYRKRGLARFGKEGNYDSNRK